MRIVALDDYQGLEIAQDIAAWRRGEPIRVISGRPPGPSPA
jgi:hypothetical protein